MVVRSSIGNNISDGLYSDTRKKKQNIVGGIQSTDSFLGQPNMKAQQTPIVPEPNNQISSINPQPTNMGANAIQSTNNFLGQPNIKPIATKSQPVIDRTPVVPKTEETPTYQQPDYSMTEGMDQSKLQGFIDSITLKQARGIQPTDTEILNLLQAQRRLQSPQQTITDPYTGLITTAEQQRDSDLERIKKQAEGIYTSREKEIQDRYDMKVSQQERAGERISDRTSRQLSFSGVGRSSYAADQQQQIQEGVNANIDIINQQRDAEILLEQATRNNATQDVLQSYNEYIAGLRGKSGEFQAGIVEKMNEYNLQNTANYQEKVNNILQLAMQFEETQAPLTEDEIFSAKNYANLAIDRDGKINNEFIKLVPPRLLGEVLKEASMLKGAIPEEQKDFGFMNVGGGLVAVTDPATGVVTYQQGEVPKEYESKIIDDKPYAFDPLTGEYIPGTMESVSGDLRQFASQFPGQARAKNNNPSGITRHASSDALKQAWIDAGLEPEIGTERPSNEGGNYVAFPTIEQGMEAMQIALQRGNQDIYERLQQRVGGAGSEKAKGYANSIMQKAGIEIGTSFAELTPEQRERLNYEHIRRESPGLAKLLGGGSGGSGGGEANDKQKDIWLSLIRTGNITNTKRQELAEQAVKEGWGEEYQEAIKEGAKSNLTDRQYDVFDKQIARFEGNPQVKQFEEAMQQYGAVKEAVERNDGVGDMSAIFAFMKTLDPSSVVRESEFEAAANSTGVFAKRGNIFRKLNKGHKLTKDQARSFAEMANIYAQNRATTYNRLYDDMDRVLEQFDIPQEFRRTNATEQLIAMNEDVSQQPTTQESKTQTVNESDPLGILDI